MKRSDLITSLFLAGLFVVGVNFVLMPTAVSASEKTGSSKDIDSGDEKFDRIFKEARDLHDKEEWKKAIEKFNEIVCDCPDKKYVDAAFYWLARSYKKLKMYKDAEVSLARLMKNFPDSSWLDDARVMLYELRVSSPAPASVYTNGTGNSGVRVTGPLIVGGSVSNVLEVYSGSQRIRLDRQDEIKLAAFQSLLAGDRKRGIELLGEILKVNSKFSETLKREAIRAIRSSHYYTGRIFSEDLLNPESLSMEIDLQNRTLLRDILVHSFQDNPNVKIRTEIIYSLINLNDDRSLEHLMQLYLSESEREIKKAIINALGGAGNSFFFVSGQMIPLETTTVNKLRDATESAAAEKVSLTGVRKTKSKAENELVVKAQGGGSKVVSRTTEFKKIYFDKLLEIVRVEKDEELRRLAFSNLQRFVGWSTRDGIAETFSQMYDADNDEQFKISIIGTLGNLKNAQATNKLLNIAKNDKSDKLRIEAINALRGNKNPEVIKFLEDLIR